METTSTIKYIGISRRKIARLANECKKKTIKEVKPKLSLLPQHAARELFKAIRSAEANFQFKNPNFNTDDLIVKSIVVEQGPTMKRMMPRARGSADVIKKRSSHIRVTLFGDSGAATQTPAKAAS
jgi:large subunit ribosomal protein L22